VALRLVCDREAEIEAFKTQEYWSIEALLATAKGETFTARLAAIAGKRLDRLDIKDGASANAIKAAIEGGAFKVASVEKKAVRRNPAAPFTTSTLQQEASRKLGYSAKQTMNLAQRLYEGVEIDGEVTGLITYMRTDGVTIIPEAVSAIRGMIEDTYSKRYLPPFIREYKAKAKNAQEAHEAIRPTDVRRKPEDVKQHLDRDQARLYDLIWKRAVASQMASAELEQTTADIAVPGRDGKAYGLRATGSVVQFDGFMRLYEEGRDDRPAKNGKADAADAAAAAEDDDSSRRLPPLAQGDALKDRGIEAKQHFTEPPPRYTEATLVKRMEELGIGRPSTYASTLAVLEDRDYVEIDRKRLIPQDKGRLVTAFLESFFKRYVEYDFTAALEEKLDLISDGKLEYKIVLREFWRDFIGAVEGIKDLRVSEVLEALNEILGPHIFPPKEDGGDPRQCPVCGEGRLSLKVSGKFGAFIGCSRYPDCRYTRQLSAAGNGTDAEASTPDGKILGYDPESGLAVALKVGRFGPYLQLGEGSKDEKPKRSSFPTGFDPNTIDLEGALKLLSLPRHIGDHPETGKPISAGLGRYGPFILHDGTYANLPSAEELFTVGINRAVVLLAEKKAGKTGRFQRAQATVLKELGEHPSEGGNIQILSGRYGPYVKHGDVNATLPRNKAPETLTVEEAVQLIAERAAKGPSKGKARRGKSSTTKPARGETAAAAQQANGAPATRKPKTNGKNLSNPGAKAPPAKGKPPRSRKTAT
jgi:DNA topoisomerase-1